MYLRSAASSLDHGLDLREADSLARDAHADGGVLQQLRVSDDRGAVVAHVVGLEFEGRSVGVTSTDVTSLELLELLLGAELVGLRVARQRDLLAARLRGLP